ncbi:exonuclease domain-containing protein [Nocardiopsis sp. NPDC006198]|uniref:exonuclease domain-containing protein n=1 Tax=Nocardiopsis sp. NPDC006198 TaxID=3154472 RepID=UPI0033A05A39
MHPWYTQPLAALDFESTGLDVATDRIVSAALWRIDPLQGDKSLAQWLADPGIDIPAQATRIHGITTDRARREGRPAVEVIAEFAAHLRDAVDEGRPVVVYNAPYDLTLLHHELARHGQRLDCAGQLRVIDPLVLDLHADPHRSQSRRLGRVCAHYGVSLPDEKAHTAAADALAAARLVWRLGHAHPALAGMSVEALHAAQVRWKAEQAAARQARLRRTTDPAAVVPASWPLNLAPAAV